MIFDIIEIKTCTMRVYSSFPVILIAVLSFISCTKSSKKPYTLPDNPIALLAGKTGKTWKLAWRYNNGTRMNMRGCFLSYRATYSPNMMFKDNNGDHENCGSTLLGNWEIIKGKKGNSYIKLTSDLLPDIMNIDKKYKFFKILKLHRDTLRIQFRHKQFSSTSTFVDTFVSEHIGIKDRDFHW